MKSGGEQCDDDAWEIMKGIWVFDQAQGQDGRILAMFFFACLWTGTKSRSINTQKKNKVNIQPSSPNKLPQ